MKWCAVKRKRGELNKQLKRFRALQTKCDVKKGVESRSKGFRGPVQHLHIHVGQFKTTKYQQKDP